MIDPWIESIEFHSSHHDPYKIPQNKSMPQAAFCGRSNAGKSSMINAIVGKKDLVHTSSTPGKTRSLNFFLLNRRIFLVDLPGFGYAKASHSVRDYMIEVVNGYLNHADTLRMLFILCDSARPLPEDEKKIIDICLAKEIQPILLRTKVDKLNQKQMSLLKKESEELIEEFNGLFIVHSSVKDNSGLQNVRNLLKTL